MTSRKDTVRSRSRSSLIFAAVVTVALSGCSPAPSSTPSTVGSSDAHGEIAGAEEVSEPQLGLTTIDPAGAIRHLDLLDESVRELGAVGAPERVGTDGRYLFADTGDGVAIVDSGVWTWDHVDHFHYYRAEPRDLGIVTGDGPATIATTNSSTTGGAGVFFAGSGEAVLLDTEALSKGERVELFRIDTEPHAGMVVPIGSSALVTQADAGIASSLVAYDATGNRIDDVAIDCAEAQGTITTRVGAVIGCRDGAVLATHDGDDLVLEKVPYPVEVAAPPATAFANREGRPAVAGLAGDAGIWMLDTRQKQWTLLPAPTPLLQVTAVDDTDQNVLALAADGRVLVLDGTTGAERAATPPLLAGSLADAAALAGVTLIADQQRAYLNAPLEQKLYEIDFADAARVARTFETDTVPAYLAETGR
jgi:hypothetical protein